VKKIASQMDAQLPFHTASKTAQAPWRVGDDRREVQNVSTAIAKNALIAPGLHNATIPADRFASGPVHDQIAKYAKPEPAGPVISGQLVKDRGEVEDRFRGFVVKQAEEGRDRAWHWLTHREGSPSPK